MPTLITYEQRTIRLAVTDMPDTPSWDGRTQLVPHAVEITYTRDSSTSSDRVDMTARRRLKGGGIGRAERTEKYRGPGRDRPDWIDDLVEQYRPADWPLADPTSEASRG